jgi:tetrahydromethanopterin S-methyltransferase subunit G
MFARDRGQKAAAAAKDEAIDLEQVNRRLDMIDQRLDSLDSLVTAAIERVMRQAVTIHVVCPKCGKNIEIAIIGNTKPTP